MLQLCAEVNQQLFEIDARHIKVGADIGNPDSLRIRMLIGLKGNDSSTVRHSVSNDKRIGWKYLLGQCTDELFREPA